MRCQLFVALIPAGFQFILCCDTKSMLLIKCVPFIDPDYATIPVCITGKKVGVRDAAYKNSCLTLILRAVT